MTALGVAEDDDRGSGTPWGESWLQAIEFQRQLYEIAGPPDTEALGREYTKNLEDAREMLAYYQTAPYRGNDSNWREGQLKKTTEEVAWREQLLEQLLG